jgi:hypothetical protein
MSGTAKTYRGAMRVASNNQNAYPPRYFDENGVELHNDGYGLAYPEPEMAIAPDGSKIERRVYAV